MRRFLLAGLTLTLVAAAPPVPSALQGRAVLPGHAEFVHCVAFSPDGKTLAAGSRGHQQAPFRRWGDIRLWDVASGKLRAKWEGRQDEPTALAFAPDGKALISGTSTLERIRWDVASGKAEHTVRGSGSFYSVNGLRFSPDSKRVGACGTREVVVWDAATGKEVLSHKFALDAWNGVLSHDLRLAAAPNHQDVDLWDIQTGKLVRSLLDHRGRVGALSFSADDRLLAVGSVRTTDEYEYRSEVWLWDVRAGKRLLAIPLGGLFCRCVELSATGDLLAVSGSLGLAGEPEVRLFETAGGGEVAKVRPAGARAIGSLRFRPDGTLLAAGCADRTVRLWTVKKPGAKNDPE